MNILFRNHGTSSNWLYSFILVLGGAFLVRAGDIQNLEIYLLPHSHVDIGYTKLQSEVEKDHWRFYEQWIEAARQTETFPPGSRFKGNVEVLWAVESYLNQVSLGQREAFIDAVKKGWIGLDGLYSMELTALCRPEELGKILDAGNRLRQKFAVPIESAMLTDVPGCTWGMVSVLAQSGIKYLSLAPNSNHRIGHIHDWDGKPFYWVSPCGRYKILCWQTTNGYQPAFRNEEELKIFIEKFQKSGSSYPYDILYFRQSMGDNQPLSADLPAFVRDWNSQHRFPKLVIATTSELFREFERRYGDRIPSFSGDLTPYWEDGAASSAKETAMNRTTAERLVQADILMAMLDIQDYPAGTFTEAWRNVLLYDEHTWGARSYVNSSMHCWPPGSKEYDAQWKIKQEFAQKADRLSRDLLDQAVSGFRMTEELVKTVDVINTSSWVRTDMVVLPVNMKIPGEQVKDPDGKIVLSQRLSNGALAFLVEDVPPFAFKRYSFGTGPVPSNSDLVANDSQLFNDTMGVTIDRNSGSISSIIWRPFSQELVNDKGRGLNDYVYIDGYEPDNKQYCGGVTVRVKDQGPLTVSLLIESDAPGCKKLSRELRLIAGITRLDILNVVDKEEIPLADLFRKPNPRKEGVYFGFDFNIPGGMMYVDSPWAVVRADIDQLAGSCKNFFTVQRWIDIANRDYGITWAAVDAPLVVPGEIPRQPSEPTQQTTVDGQLIWRKELGPTQKYFSNVMNNYWTTNYRHSQGGETTFRYSIRPHWGWNGPDAARFGVECSQGLLVIPAYGTRRTPSFLSVESSRILVTALKRGNDGKSLIVRLFNVGSGPEKPELKWARKIDGPMYISNFAEDKILRVNDLPVMEPYEIVTVLVDDFPKS